MPDRITIGEMRDEAAKNTPGCLDQRASERVQDSPW